MYSFNLTKQKLNILGHLLNYDLKKDDSPKLGLTATSLFKKYEIRNKNSVVKNLRFLVHYGLAQKTKSPSKKSSYKYRQITPFGVFSFARNSLLKSKDNRENESRPWFVLACSTNSHTLTHTTGEYN